MHALLAALKDAAPLLQVTGLRGGAAALFVSRTETLSRPVLCIAASEREALALEQDLGLFSTLPVALYPGYDIPPYAPLAPDPKTIASRLAALYQAVANDSPFILIAPVEALLRRTIPRKKLGSLAEIVIRNEETDREDLAGRLIGGGYESVALVQSVGEFSVRGGIFDVFPPGFELPLRLDFFGDTIESIRPFDPISQRSAGELDEAVLLPANDILYPPADSHAFERLIERFTTEADSLGWEENEAGRILEKIESRRDFPGSEFFLPLFYAEPSSPFDYLPSNTLVVTLDQIGVRQALHLTWERITANYEEALATNMPAFSPEKLFLTDDQLRESLARFGQVRLQAFSSSGTDEKTSFAIASGSHALLKQDIELRRKTEGLLPPLAKEIASWLEQGDRVFLACRSTRHARHMAELLGQYQIPLALRHAPLREEEKFDGVLLYDQPLSAGFDLPHEKLHWLSESELFGERRLGAKKKAAAAPREGLVRFEELNNNDFVVHRNHGIGLYQGLVKMELNNIANDFLQINYKDDDKLYVPVDQINTVSKYKGIADKKPALDKLGGKAWSTTRKKVQKAVWKVAQDLLNLYASRQISEGRAFAEPDELYRELEESFPFDETPGQLKAINEVLEDLTSERPMDRLVCGDVGYGKTEVAIRAAFKVAEDNHQVAILVPTTVLAEQHAETFRDRLEGFPVRIESLNRFRSQGEQKKIVKDLAEGKVDIVIGTHRLLSKDVLFKRLGLLIIDEEHRFGVIHKEKLKKLRAQVDVLTLTATPIPRTLQLSLLGVRDLSVISSPPAHRRTVKTFVARHDDLVIKEAVRKELQRNGQVFLVHNRVNTIHEVARKVHKLTPEANVAVAHGQMPSKSLEEIMIRFVRKEIQVLVCTTIIESGLDIPNANTIIITRADRLGLAEIYQLRGRVGRSREQAYAYLLVPSLNGLSKDAQQRLRALMDYNELGGGFKLAMSDLQIRGGGNILGESQSGTIAAVGYDLYLDLLQKTVLDLKRKAQRGEEGSMPEEIEPEINLKLSAYIPEEYIADTAQRYIAYRRITGAETEEALWDLQDELRDRYGPVPEETRTLFQVITLKNDLKQLRVTKLEQGPFSLVFSFHESTPVSPHRILQLIAARQDTSRFTPDGKLILRIKGLEDAATIFQEAKKMLHALMGSDI